MPRWHKEIFRSPDPDVRRAAARLILAGRKSASSTLDEGCVLEFARGGHLHCGVVWPSVKGRSLLVVDVGGAEVRVRRDKVIHQSTHRIPTGRRAEALRALRSIDSRREDLREAIDMATVWEVALEADEGGQGGKTDLTWSLDRLSDLSFGSAETEDGRAALLRALDTGDWFTRGTRGRSGWVPLSRRVVERKGRDRLLRQREKRELEIAAGWLRAVADGDVGAASPPDAEEVLRLLERVCLSEAKGDADGGRAAELMARAHLHGAKAAFRVLVSLGHWKEDENLDLHRWGVPVAFSGEAESAATRQSEAAMWLPQARPCRRVWWGRRAVVGFGGEDGTDTCQKAFSVARSREGYKVRAFYAAPALALEEGGVLDREAASRGVTLRLPDQEIPLLPPAVEQKVRLSAAEARPALCLEISLDADLRIRRCKLRLRRVKPTVVPASEIPASAETDERLGAMASLASRLRIRRVSEGAVILPADPDLSVRDGCSRIVGPKDGIAELIAGELDLLAAAAVGDLCLSERVPAIYQVQDSPPSSPSRPGAKPSTTEGMVADDAVAAHPLQRNLRWPRLQVEPAANKFLGLKLCVAVTEPLHRHWDLVMQRQLVHLATHRQPRYSFAELESELLNTATARDAARRVTSSGRRYWMMKYLEDRAEGEVEAVVLERAGFGYVVLLDECYLKTYVPADRQLWATAGDRVRLKVEQVSARRDEVRLTDPRPVEQAGDPWPLSSRRPKPGLP